eukprot:g2595.t1
MKSVTATVLGFSSYFPLRFNRFSTRVLPPPIFASQRAEQFFTELLKLHNSASEIDRPVGVRLDYKPRGLEMIFSFDIVGENSVNPLEEKLVVNDDLTIYVAQRAVMQVLGCTVDVDIEKMNVQLFDKEGKPLKPVNH